VTVRTLAVGCPDWAAEVAARRTLGAAGAAGAAGVAGAAGAAGGRGVPVAVVWANRIVSTTPAARAVGVRNGQRRREAQRACPGLVLLAPDPVADAQAFEPVVQALAGLAARIEVLRPGWCTITARSASRYYGGDEALVARVHAAVAAAGPVGAGWRVAIADGRFSALVLAARTPDAAVVVPAGGSPDALAGLPVSAYLDALDALGAGGPGEGPGGGPGGGGESSGGGGPGGDRAAWRELTARFGRLGLRTLGDVAVLPAADLTARFGPLGQAAHRWAAGTDPTPLALDTPVGHESEVLELEPPVATAEPVAFAVRAVAEALCGRLTGAGRTCHELAVGIGTEHGEHDERRWRRELGFTAATITERVRWQLEGWAAGPTPPTGGIVSVRLTPVEVVADTGRQGGFWGGRTDADERAARAVARLVGLLGPGAVLVPEWRGGRDPDEVCTLVPAVTVELTERAAAVIGRPGAGPWPGALPAPSPAWVAPSPEPVEVLGPGGEVVTVSGRGMLGVAPAWFAGPNRPRVAVVEHAGPWPVEDRWWDPQRRRRRARLQLLLADGTACLVVREHGAWWLMAIYD